MPLFLYIFTLIFAPLAFGTVEYWSIGMVEAVVPATLLLLYVDQRKKNKPLVRVPGLLPLILLICWMALQLVPLPAGLVQTIAPKIYDIYQPILRLSEQPGWIPLTVQPKATLQELLRFSSYSLFFILTVQLLSSPDYLKKTTAVIAWLGIAIAIEAILQKLTSAQAIYWLRPSPQSASPVGPWVYSNHFAGFMAMIFPLVLALFLYFRPNFDDQETLRSKIIALFTMPGTNKYLLFGFGALLIGVSILLSVSRGGIITLCLALVFFVIFSSNLTGQWRNRWAVLLIILVILMISWLGWDPIVQKFGNIWGDQGLNTNGRLPVLLDSLKMTGDFLLTGSGFGTYEVTFPAYRTVPGDGIVFDHAHNDYIELLATGGLIGFLLAAWFVLSVVIQAVQMLRKRRDRYSQLLTIAALTAIIALLLHSVVDFQMYNGANGLYFFFFCGLAIAAANTRRHYRTPPTLLATAGRSQQSIPVILALTVLVAGLYSNSANYRARRTFATIRDVYLNKNIPEQRVQELYLRADKAARLDILEANYPFAKAEISAFIGDQERARNEYLKASTLKPLSGRFIQQLALILAPARAETTDSLLALGCRYEPLFLDRYLTYANWLIASGKQAQALSIIHQALEQQPQWSARLGHFVFFNALSRSDITTMLPAQPQAWYEMGKIMEKEGSISEAEYYYLQALLYLDGHKAQAAYFSRLYTLYMQQHSDNKALTILRQGIKHLPDNAAFHRQLGDYYRTQGILYRATEEYRQALQLNPQDLRLKRRLDELQLKGEKKE